ncbi:TonB-dependent receptor [Sphingomonas morindae]|uniref:TonB-dependent receptor n=1 Tax=Sphingomonas morindae TaxID=1541170 RepID=A0ABY4X5D4_9SPHN|nr:TonB-dependent receptor [Sphingomonas morindae]USI72112.1 TonB-dependent receptor [Sphingomonas morindae]
MRHFLTAAATMTLLLPGAAWAADSEAKAAAAPADGRHETVPTDIVVTANARSRKDILSSVTVLSGETLQEIKRASIGETLASQPGVSATSFGPTASRPILRGLGGDRIRVLTDGIGSFDASATSADHAVAINPLTADRIEVIRGPAALLYGSSAIGGVVNVIDSRIPRRVPQEPIHAALDAGYGSAAQDRNVAGAADLPIGGHWVAHVDGSFDKSGDLETGGFVLSAPLRAQAAASDDPAIRALGGLRGKIPNTQARSWSVAGGLAYINDGGSIGLAVTRTASLYGVPIRYSLDPAIEDEQPRIDLRQTRVDFRAELTPHGPWLDTLRLRAGYADYRHDELEPDGAIATTFLNKGMEARLDFVQAKRGAWSGESGGQILTRDFSAIGDEKFLPPSHAEQYGLFTLQRLGLGALKLEAGGRIEHQDANAAADATLGNPRLERRLTTYSGSVGAGYTVAPGYRLGLNLTHSERAPSVEELFSNGPHGGTQAFEVGDTGLGKEKSNGAELTAHGGGTGYSIDLSAYYNHFSNFIYQTPTGEVRDDLPVYAYRSGAANQWGFEAAGEATLARLAGFTIKADGQADYVRITIRQVGPAPLIPPLRLRGGLSAGSDHWDLRGEAEHAFRHDRIAENETETPGYTLVNAAIAYRPRGTESPITLRLQANNLFDVVARRSTSLLKDYAPLAGRDIRLGVSVRI